MAVADDQDGAAELGGAAELSQAAQVTRAQVGHPTRMNRPDAVDRALLVGERACRYDDLGLVVEGDDAEVVGRFEPLSEVDERPLNALQRRTAHGPAAVEDDLHRAGRSGRVERGGGCVQVEQDGDLVGRLVRHAR